jgi:phage shock protein A
MALLGALKGFFRVTDRKAAESLENSDPVEFAKNDMEDMKHDMQTVMENLGHIKARMSQLTDDMKDLQDQINNDTNKAQALIAKHTDATDKLAEQLCKEVEGFQAKLDVLKGAMTQQEGLLTQFEDSKAALEDHMRECQNDLEIMKTQQAVTDANKSLVNVDTGKSGSAVQRFKERRRKLDEQLRVSSEMVKQAEPSKSLAQQADEALGKTKGSALFASLKAGAAPKV